MKLKRFLLTAAGIMALSLCSAESPVRPREGKASKGIAVFPEVQMHYGTYNNFYHHGHWNDRPLYMNRDDRYTGFNYQPMTEASILREMEILRQGGYSGMTPLGPLSEIQQVLDVYAKSGQKDLLILPGVFPPVTMKQNNPKISVQNFLGVAKLQNSPHVFRINGKMVINSYTATELSPAKWKALLQQARKESGDNFLFVADMLPAIQSYAYNSGYFFNKGNPKKEATEKLINTLQAYLDVCDGIQVYPFTPIEDPAHTDRLAMYRKYSAHIVELVRQVMARPQNRGKILAAVCATGYVNPMSGRRNLNERGTGLLRDTMEACLALDPDYIVPFEWNEWNENTGFIPTVKKGSSVSRLMGYYRSFFPGEKRIKTLSRR